MITLEQIQLLETKVHKAVARMSSLKEENTALREKLDTYEKRITELEGMVNAFKEDQAEIERGIITALEKLDALEDASVEDSDTQPVSAGSPQPEKAETGQDDSVASSEGGDDDAPVWDMGKEDSAATQSEDGAVEEEPEPPTDGELDIF